MTDVGHVHKQALRRLAVSVHLSLFVFLAAAARLPLFDASPHLVPISQWARPLLRWDTFHFVHVAEDGYLYEHDWAFLPGTSIVMNIMSRALGIFWDAPIHTRLLQGGAMVALACDTTTTLYDLTLELMGSAQLAYMAALLSLMPSSPVTLLLVPYNEPFFTYLSYKGMLQCARKHFVFAACLFSAAGLFRSNGLFLVGFIVWGKLVEPILEGIRPKLKGLILTVLLTALIFIPFLYHNFSAYVTFCNPQNTRQPPFCTKLIPVMYTYVQAKYWDVGLLRYWTLQQLPNFIIAAPPFLFISAFAVYHLKVGLIPRLASRGTKVRGSSPFLDDGLTPHALHALIFCCVLLFASHVQILLRLAASMPLTYWAVSWLIYSGSSFGRWCVTWSICWGVVSVILWVAFLPPA